jgi:hypothetical protein
MPFEFNRLPEYTEAAILAEIHRVAQVAEGKGLTIPQFSKLSKVSLTTVRRRFGSWPKALEAAGLIRLYNAPAPRTRSCTFARSLTDEEIISEIRRVGQIVGDSPLTAEDLQQYASVGLGAIRGRFGTVREAIRAAGLSGSAHGRRYTDEECFENLLQVWTHLGRAPQYQEMKRPPSIVGPKAYIVRWKTWNRALHAFVQRVNSDNGGEEGREELAGVEHGPCGVKPSTTEEDDHNVRLGLRYKVLARDNFKCSLCGNSPAVDLRCRLHVDHILPWSKGGKTLAHNLRALCEQCNLGKGDKVCDGGGG